MKHEYEYEGYFCPVPFESVYIDCHGNMSPHCEGLVTVSMGSLIEKDFFDVWNSDTAQKMRESILDGSFQFCTQQECRVLKGKKLLKTDQINREANKNIIKNRITVCSKGPAALNLGYDPSCNLTCGSCRTERTFSTDHQKTAGIIHQKIMGSHLKDARRVVLSCMGEPFASKFYRSFLQEYDPSLFPDIRIQVLTNGLLFTPGMWERMPGCHRAIDTVAVSIDAATEKTYKNMRGGDFKKLTENLEFISTLRKKNIIKNLCIDFVVQVGNYKEIKSFVAFGKKYACDWVAFKHIENWGTLTDSAFRKLAVHDPSHPEHRDLIKILEDPAMNDPIVWMRNLTHLFPEKDETYKFLTLCDQEVFDIMLNTMEWDHFRTWLLLSDIQSSKIKKVLETMKGNAADACSCRISERALPPIEHIAHHVKNAHEMDESSLLALCSDYSSREMKDASLTSIKNDLIDMQRTSLNEINRFLNPLQRISLNQFIKIKSLWDINTGYFPLKSRLRLILNDMVHTSH